MSFQSGLSGLNAASRNLAVIGNNVANTSTVGFKGARAQFSDVFAASLLGGGGNAVGVGTNVMDVSQQFTQGNITVTNNPLDVALTGEGFFVMQNRNGGREYSRNGQFQLDRDGFLVNSMSQPVMGFLRDRDTGVLVQQLAPIQLNTVALPAKPTGGVLPPDPATEPANDRAARLAREQVEVRVNLNADASTETGRIFRNPPLNPGDPVPPDFNPGDPSSFNSSTSLNIFDSRGNPHILTLYYRRTGDSDWSVYGAVNGNLVNSTGVETAAPPGSLFSLRFSPNGQLLPNGTGTPSAQDFVDINWPEGNIGQILGEDFAGVNGLNFRLNASGSTLFSAPFNVNRLAQTGYAPGELNGFSIGDNGAIVARYSNGQTLEQGRIQLVSFTNPQGLIAIGNNNFVETFESGAPQGPNEPGSGNLGALRAGAVEEANVDLTQELVNMITAQRAYQANAQTIKTQDAVLQTLVNLR